MARPIVMPSLGMYTAEGTLVAWLRRAGDIVEVGETIAEVSTEKATFEIVAPAGGILHPVAEVGANLPVEMLMGYILADAEEPPAPPLEGASAGLPSPSSKSQMPTVVQSLQATIPPSPEPSNQPTEIRATPIARRLAAQHGIDLARVSGSGPGGRIVEADVLATVAKRGSLSVEDQAAVTRRIRQRVPLAGMRRTIARRLRHSLATAASVTVTREVHADTLVACRSRLAEKPGLPLSYDALFIKLFATALREHPELNATIENETILILDEMHVGFAVPVPDGILVPIVHNADSEPLLKIAARVQELSDRARSGQLRQADTAGGTVTITNLGAHGIDVFTPILNPPQSVVLGIGRIAPRPIVRDGLVLAGRTCILSLTFDHCVADGVPAAQLLEVIARLMTDEQYLMALV